VSITAVLGQQYRAMERMALSSGASIASFVASNAALPSVENAAAPPEERDWTPIQAFIAAASSDQSVRWMTMVDADGVVRGASDPKMLGTRYRAPTGESIVRKDADGTVTNITLSDGRDGFRFVHPIIYAGRKFGLIEVSISKAQLEQAAATSRDLMIALGAVILGVVALISFSVARLLARPLRRLKGALRDAAMGDLDFRISHKRRDEFGELFDGFNLFVQAMQDRLEAAERPSGGPRPLEATRIDALAPAPERGEAADPSGTPFDPSWRRSN
jgi:serine/threonine-protein kinase